MSLLQNPATAIAWKMRDIQHRHMLMIHRILERHNLHFGQPRILRTVAEMDGASQREIADKLGISPASLAMSIKRMCKAGLLEKVVNDKDQRTNQIRITALGLQQNIACLTECAQADTRMLEGLSTLESEQLSEMLSRIYDNLMNMTADKDA